MGSPSLFYNDPAVHREDSAPADRPRSIDPDERIRMFRGVRQESGAGSIRSLAIPAPFADKVVRRPVGGGVVLAASYEAKSFGVSSRPLGDQSSLVETCNA